MLHDFTDSITVCVCKIFFQWWNVTKYIYSGVLLICSSDVMFCSFSILSENVVFCTPCYSFKISVTHFYADVKNL